MATRNLVPRTNREGGLGRSDKYWGNLYVDDGHINALTINDSLTLQTTPSRETDGVNKKYVDDQIREANTAAAQNLSEAIAALKNDTLKNYLTTEIAASTYLTKEAAETTYLTKNEATENYLTNTSASSMFLTKEDASSLYVTSETANKTFATKSELDGMLTVENLPTMAGANSTQAGRAGIVPQPKAGEQNKFLAGDGTYKAIDTSGFVPTSEVANVANKIPRYNGRGHLVFPNGAEIWVA